MSIQFTGKKANHQQSFRGLANCGSCLRYKLSLYGYTCIRNLKKGHNSKKHLGQGLTKMMSCLNNVLFTGNVQLTCCVVVEN